MPARKPILETKIQIPPLAPTFVPRQRLYERLDAALQPIKRLTLISAPAGYGKTSLASAWIKERNIPAAWIALNEQDNDPVRFGDYLRASITNTYPDLDLKSQQEGPYSELEYRQTNLIPLLNQLSQSHRSTVIVLDDFHYIHDNNVQRMVDFMLENLPASLHMILLSRADPAIAIAKLRGRGQLIELRMQDLRFQLEEVKAFIDLFQGVRLPIEDVQTLTHRTEGWIAGLQMAVASLQGHSDQSSFIRHFSGDHQYIMDFLLDEVLRRQPQDLQSFLLKTSILERLNGSVCDAILHRTKEDGTPSEQILHNLVRANLFVVPLDEQQNWFRYHRLFADLLQARLKRDHPESIEGLHRRASSWFEQHDELEAAMRHAVKSNDFNTAADLLERVSQQWLMNSETTTFLRWIQCIPPEAIKRHPRLVIYNAWALLFQGAPLRVVNALIPVDNETNDLPGGAALLRSFLSLNQGQTQDGLVLAEQALSQLEEGEIFLRDFAKFCTAAAHIAQGDEQFGHDLLNETIESSLKSGNRSAAVILLSELAEIRMKEMCLDEAERLYEQARNIADNEGNLLPIGGRALIGLGSIALERNQIDQAEVLVTHGIELCSRWNVFSTLEGHLDLATVHYIRGDYPKFEAKFDELINLAIQFDATELDDLIVDLVMIGFRARQGDYSAVEKWLVERGLEHAPNSLPPAYSENSFTAKVYKYELPIVIRFLTHKERFEEAQQAIKELLAL
ncbi:MAG: hypothetical protein PVG02_08725, partial [Anaerolineales bacterium]